MSEPGNGVNIAGAIAEAIRGDLRSAESTIGTPRSSSRTAVLSPTTPAPMTAIGEASCWCIRKEYELRACEFGLACDSVFQFRERPVNPPDRQPESCNTLPTAAPLMCDTCEPPTPTPQPSR